MTAISSSNAAQSAEHQETAASTFRLDVKGADVRGALSSAGVRSILLKGPGVARLLYAHPRSRNYSDVDLLVDPAAAAAAGKVLAGLGFRRVDPESPVRQTDADVGGVVGAHGGAHATMWARDRDKFVVDLHDTLPQCGVAPATVWHHATQHVEVRTVGGIVTEVLDRPASALLVALHAVHHGPAWGHAATDLGAAIEAFDHECWVAARELAAALGAEAAMGIGLGMDDAGEVIARRLGLPTESTRAHRLRWAGAPWSVSVLDSLMTAHGLGARLALVSRILWPTPPALRRGSSLARRGRLGLLAAYALRALRLVTKLPAAMRTRRWSDS